MSGPCRLQIQETAVQSPPDSNSQHSNTETAVTQEKSDTDNFLVDWDDDDPENPQNWSMAYKLWLTIQLALLAFIASLGSSIMSPAIDDISTYTGVSHEVNILCVSLYVLGFAVGPILWAPISEVWGRKWSLLPAMFCLGLFSIGTATSTKAASIFITRFFGGLFGSSPVSNVVAALGDIWNPKARGTPVAFFSLAIMGGAVLGPVIGACITVNSQLGWRWTAYVEAILAFAVVALSVFCLPESYAPRLLCLKAMRMRQRTGIERYYHPHELTKLDVRSVITKHLARPLRMLFTEPIVACLALYASFVYMLLYLTLEVFPIVFEQNRAYGPVIGKLPFLGTFVGLLCAILINISNQPHYAYSVEANQGQPVPEARLMPMVAGVMLLVIGLFWFGWTAAPQYNCFLPITAAGLIGAGSNVVTQQINNFLVDTYGLYAASAVSAKTISRSIMGAAFPLVARPMFNKLGVGPAMSILGGIGCLALPVPYILKKYGVELRRMSKFRGHEG